MKYLFSHWNRVARRLNAARHRLYLFDIDGTLAAIENLPSAAAVPSATRRLLRELSLQPRSTVGIISGRALSDARAIIGLDGLMYSGNHGLEMSWNRTIEHGLKKGSHVSALKEIHRKLRTEIAAIRGALVEWKGLTMSVHYRRVKLKDRPHFHKVVRQILPLLRKRKLRFRRGKMVVEILPDGYASKGTAVKKLVKQLGRPVTIFSGDDMTDEDVFQALGRRDISIRVGQKRDSKAAYYVKNQGQVRDLLARLARLK